MNNFPISTVLTGRSQSKSWLHGEEVQRLNLPATLTEDLNALALSFKTSVDVILLATFQVLLHRLSSLDRFCTASTLPFQALQAQGSVEESDSLAKRDGAPDCFFFQSADFSDGPTFEDFLSRQTSFNDHAGALPRLDGEANNFDRFSVAFIDRNANANTAPIEQFDWVLVVSEPSDTTTVSAIYNKALFEPSIMMQWMEHFQTLLAGAIQNPRQLVSRLPLLSETEKYQLVVGWNEPQSVRPKSKFQAIHAWFEHQASQTPDATALTFKGESLTSGQLNGRANQLAHYLRSRGVCPNTLVGICVARSLDMVVGILGILKAGGAYVPLDPSYPKARLAFMLADAQASILVTQQSVLPQLPETSLDLICLDDAWEDIARESHDNLDWQFTPENLAYVIYTSGSTGNPKGVLVSHQNLIHSTAARLDYYSEPITRYLLLSSFAFDSSVAGIFWTLCTGGTLVIPAQAVQKDPQQLTRLIQQEQISHLLCLPSLYRLCLDGLTPGANPLASLRAVIVAGEACPTPLISQHHSHLKNTALYNEYGPT
ncbi:MAG: AMP-binding protein, partial [Elainellaceae cyanobacterium]